MMAITPLPRPKGETYVIKGQLKGDYEPDRIILFDGRFDTAFRVIQFIIAPNKITGNSDVSCNAKLTTEDPTTFGSFGDWDWQDSREIGWASWYQYSTNKPDNQQAIIDPENLIIEDLWVCAKSLEDGDDMGVNYMIVMEKYKIRQEEGTLTYIRNRGQDVQ